MKAIEDALASKDLRLTELEEQAERSKHENAQAKNSSKHLARLQTDMQEYRKQNEQQLKQV